MDETSLFFERLQQGAASLQHVLSLKDEPSSREIVYQYKKLTLYHYHSPKKKYCATPVLIVFATVNRPTILDLASEYSFVKGLLELGLDIYLIDWGYPDQNDKDISFSDYVTEYLDQSVQYLTQKMPAINVIGICQGGLMSLCYATLSEKIKNLILISTPIDFSTKQNLVAQLIGQVMKQCESNLISTNLPGQLLNQFFISLKPFELIGKKYLHFVDELHDRKKTEKFLRMEKWLYDAPDQTAASWKELTENFYQKNYLIENKIELNGTRIQLNKITIPILNIAGKLDHIVPVSASRPLKKFISSEDYTQRIFNTGHIGLYVSGKESARVQGTIARWLIAR